MKVLLDGLLPRIFPKLEFVCIAHEGKKELEIVFRASYERGGSRKFVLS